ncbi:hypothetical protein [Pelagicoccus mobilis]|uniref:Pyrrolidone-carboxylate peptidase n=1 Tax=Pelagicoccus mobilis TaxID=415221 RepID=A0A934RSU0_9BACT|nr:hypothetical protein [Pelagicoccus mobilis]MBK1876940.1 hypothetical protein [Pelagicoccus mobilis]
MNLLLAGIEPTVPTSEAVAWRYLSVIGEMEFEGHHVVTLRLPAVWDDCFLPLKDCLSQKWDAVVCLADADSESIEVERIAINETDVSTKDRSGRRPRGKVIVPDGEPGYWSTLPYRELALQLTNAKLQASGSHSAGTGLANFVFYRMMHALSVSERRLSAGLIHLPERRFEEEKAERFASVLVSCLDGNREPEDSLKLNLDRIQARSGVQPRSR